MSLTPNEAKFNLGMLDRVTISGHTEREAMNVLVYKLRQIMDPSATAKNPDANAKEGISVTKIKEEPAVTDEDDGIKVTHAAPGT